MEVLFVSHKYPPATGGMEKQSYELINEMDKLCKVHKIVYDGNGGRLRFFATLARRIRRVLAANPGIEVVHFNDGLMAAFCLQMRLNGVKRAVTLHGLDVVFPGFIYQRFIFPRFNRFDLLIAVSRATARAAVERGIYEHKLVVINNGVDLLNKISGDRLQVEHWLKSKYGVDAAGRKVLLALGRPVKRKGFSWMIKYVMPKINPIYLLLIVGPVQLKRPIYLRLLPDFLANKLELFLGAPSDEREINRLIIDASHRVRRLGKLPQEELDDLMAIADLFVMPNIEVEGDLEGFGLVCLEAAIKGVPVLASGSGGITDAIIHGKNGLIMPPGHRATWVHTLNKLAEDGYHGLTPDAIAHYTGTHYSWKKMAKEYLQYFLAIQ